jgi:hypothetical protein
MAELRTAVGMCEAWGGRGWKASDELGLLLLSRGMLRNSSGDEARPAERYPKPLGDEVKAEGAIVWG